MSQNVSQYLGSLATVYVVSLVRRLQKRETPRWATHGLCVGAPPQPVLSHYSGGRQHARRLRRGLGGWGRHYACLVTRDSAVWLET